MSKLEQAAKTGAGSSGEGPGSFDGVTDPALFKRFRLIPTLMERKRKELEELADERTDLIAELVNRGWTQSDIARNTDLTRMSISRIARGIRGSGS